MKPVFFLAALAAVYCAVESKSSPPKVQVYSQKPGEFGAKNTLICHVTNFHPPDITITLLKNGVEIPGATQTDLAFESNWHFHLTKHVDFTPEKDEKFSCKVTHGQSTNTYAWEPNM
ncbi:beta-2-microglobulin-like [Mastacembelus armatus]|uniref:beta-2-microglobulin-like n=1 Tax=Mastacembelus armatus TaxID=205130 RepID=UPI000E45B7AE|nr:beta-2-microglobulin-like [Mastacembelus armatus]